jgi:pimeloyl-ACP methyl ester carboxylesterase
VSDLHKEAEVIDSAHSRFRWLERGDGEPVLLLHGLMGEMDHWESTLDNLGAFCRPIAPELPIFDAGLVDVSVPGLAEHVRRFMETLELPPAIVGGNSLLERPDAFNAAVGEWLVETRARRGRTGGLQ